MATITEDYVSFETAKLLKEIGFDGVSTIMYKENGKMCINPKSVVSWRLKYWYPCLTLQMAMKWLREVHGLFIFIDNDDLDYSWQIIDVRNRTKDLDPTCLTESYAGYRKYELACEAATKYCLEHLI